MSRLELRPATRSGSGTRTERHFLDYVVDGQPWAARHRLDEVTPLGWGTADLARAAVAQLLVEAPPDLDGRVALYVCAECGDHLCGALTARVSRQDDVVTWSDFADTYWELDRWEHDPTAYVDWRAVRFSLPDYRRALAVALPG
ncbi:hypothetical protein EV189_1069 [Motilibacter rhizosphaerae]|uniref:Uncharacterized protein n=2 Tax=Motilibacter rhizosphaerae TaxID=598652 RepID=A0A4Q7NX81_9ACTN|nr:hypothetical protein EV189_1069 [Motilibacter rhizosphaerae]